MELIYIGNGQSRFTRGERYKVMSVSIVDNHRMCIMDRDGVVQDFDMDIVWNYFMTMEEWRCLLRHERLVSIGI